MGNEVRYADSGGAYVAYQAIGEGSRDLLVVMEGFISVDMMDDEPRLARCMARLGSFARLIRFDRRGIGLSDPVSPSTPPTLEQWVQDAIADERNALLRDDLNAAQLRAARALAETHARPPRAADS